MRKIIKDLVAPVVERVQQDREQMLGLTKENAKQEERIKAIETIMFKDSNISTLIDDLKLRIEQGEATIRKEVAEVRDTTENRFQTIKEDIYVTDKRITANEILKEQFENFVLK